MTIAKYIECEIDEKQRTAFSQSQAAWKQISKCSGFAGQFGGWDTRNSKAIIIGLWDSQNDIDLFMKSTHDDVVEKNNQSSTYRQCSVRHFDAVPTTLAPSTAISQIALLRIAHCEGVQNEYSFIRDQEHVWNPIMSIQSGFLGGHLWRCKDDSRNFMVLTYWSSASSHSDYCENVLPELRKKAESIEYIYQLSGAVVEVNREWDVIPNKRLWFQVKSTASNSYFIRPLATDFHHAPWRLIWSSFFACRR